MTRHDTRRDSMARDKATRDNTTQNATAKATNCEPSESTAFLNARQLGKKIRRDGTTRHKIAQHNMTQNRTTRHDSTAEATVRLNKAFTAFLNAEFEGLDRRNATQRSTTQQHSLTPHTTLLFACPVHSRSDLQHGWVGQEFAVQH